VTASTRRRGSGEEWRRVPAYYDVTQGARPTDQGVIDRLLKGAVMTFVTGDVDPTGQRKLS